MQRVVTIHDCGNSFLLCPLVLAPPREPPKMVRILSSSLIPALGKGKGRSVSICILEPPFFDRGARDQSQGHFLHDRIRLGFRGGIVGVSLRQWSHKRVQSSPVICFERPQSWRSQSGSVQRDTFHKDVLIGDIGITRLTGGPTKRAAPTPEPYDLAV